jgi:hypothetical protein
MGLDSAVGIATRYGLGDPKFRIPVGVRFSAPVQTGPEANPACYTRGTGSFLGVKRPVRGVDQPSLPSAHVKERVKPSWPVLG